jgi:Cys-rich repeat protein
MNRIKLGLRLTSCLLVPALAIIPAPGVLAFQTFEPPATIEPEPIDPEGDVAAPEPVPCAIDSDCGEGGTCDMTTTTCVVPAVEPVPCAIDSDCGEGGTCDMTTTTCAVPAVEPEPESEPEPEPEPEIEPLPEPEPEPEGPQRPAEPTWGKKDKPLNGTGLMIAGGVTTGLGAAFILTSVLVTSCNYDGPLECKFGDQRDFLVPSAVALTGLGVLLIGVGLGTRSKYKKWQNWTPEKAALVPVFSPTGGGAAFVGKF